MQDCDNCDFRAAVNAVRIPNGTTLIRYLGPVCQLFGPVTGTNYMVMGPGVEKRIWNEDIPKLDPSTFEIVEEPKDAADPEPTPAVEPANVAPDPGTSDLETEQPADDGARAG